MEAPQQQRVNQLQFKKIKTFNPMQVWSKGIVEMKTTTALFFTFTFALVVFIITFMSQNNDTQDSESSIGVTDRHSAAVSKKFFPHESFKISNIFPSWKNMTYTSSLLSHHHKDPDSMENWEPGTASAITSPDLLSCKESFPPKCDIYPYVKFWNKRFLEEDCYYSPLRHPLGKNAPPSEAKYVVFQPDGGGWNNIRMAAETAILFAHATGRY